MALFGRGMILGKPPAGGFSPPDIAGLVLWLDASQSGTINHTGGLVDSWFDANAGVLRMVGSGATRPTTGATTRNGLNVVDFVADYMRLNDSAGDVRLNQLHYSVTSSGTPDTMFFVVRPANAAGTGANYGIYDDSAAASANAGLAIYYSDAGAAVDAVSHDVTRGVGGSFVCVNTSANNALPANTWNLLEVYSDPGNGTAANRSSIYVAAGAAIQNNAFTAAETAANSGFIPQLGSVGNNQMPFTGSIAEVLLYETSVTGTDRTDVRSYLGTKWSVTV